MSASASRGGLVAARAMNAGDDKVKQMVRSILPSKGRRGAAFRRSNAHRKERHATNQSLRQLGRDTECWYDECELDDSLRDVEITQMVWRRQGADKLNHFVKWAVKRTGSLPKHDRLSAMRALLPNGLVGGHAMQHLQNARELRIDCEHDHQWQRPRHSKSMARGELAQLLRLIIIDGEAHRGLHAVMRKALSDNQPETAQRAPLRALAGLHDVLPFISAIEPDWPIHHVVMRFARDFKKRLR